MFRLSVHFAGGGGAGSSSENLGELISTARHFFEHNKIKWMKMEDETNNIVLFELAAKEGMVCDTLSL